MVLGARRDGRAFVLPAANAAEAALVRDAVVHPAATLLAVCAHLAGREPLPALAAMPRPSSTIRRPDLADVRGQAQAKRALDHRGGRRTQPADDRAARHRQVDARAAAAGAPAAA